MLEREPLARLAADGELRAYRHEGFWDCMDTYKDAVVLNDLWAGAAPGATGGRPAARRRGADAREALAGHRRRTASSPRTWRGRCSSAATRCASSTGPTRGGRRRRAAPLRLDLLGLRDEVELAEADLRDAEAVAAAVAGCDSRLPPRRADDRRRRPRLARGDLRGQRARRLERLRGLPRARRCRRSSSPPPTRPTAAARACPTARTSRCAPPIPTTPARRRPTSIARSYAPAYGAAARGHPLRQRLRRRRPQLLAADPGGDRSPCSMAAAPVIRSDGSPERDFLHVDDAVAAYLAIARRARRRGRQRGRPSTPAASGRTRSREVVEPDRRGRRKRGVEPEYLGTGSPAARSTASTSTRPSCAS